jgi:hypothetical protein
MTDRKMAQDGFNKAFLERGNLQKGGVNATSSQVQARPPAPAPMRPAAPSDAGRAASTPEKE